MFDLFDEITDFFAGVLGLDDNGGGSVPPEPPPYDPFSGQPRNEWFVQDPSTGIGEPTANVPHGTGVLVDEEYVVTNHHVAEHVDQGDGVNFGETVSTVEAVHLNDDYQSLDNDLALLRIEDVLDIDPAPIAPVDEAVEQPVSMTGYGNVNESNNSQWRVVTESESEVRNFDNSGYFSLDYDPSTGYDSEHGHSGSGIWIDPKGQEPALVGVNAYKYPGYEKGGGGPAWSDEAIDWLTSYTDVDTV